MNIKVQKIVGWSLSSIIFLLLTASAVDKISGSEHSLQIAKLIGISPRTYIILGIIELISALLFLIPKTGILGLMLLSSYLGGAIATHLQHGQDIWFPISIETVVWIAAFIRFPEIQSVIIFKKTILRDRMYS